MYEQGNSARQWRTGRLAAVSEVIMRRHNLANEQPQYE